MNAPMPVVGSAYAPEALEARALARLSMAEPATAGPDAPDATGDHRLSPTAPSGVVRPAAAPGERARRAAAVLIPIVAHPGEATVLLTRRASHLRDHSGQVAFPGGKIDPEDGSALRAALREAEEEIGLDRARVRPLGHLPPYYTTTGFDILPVVARVEPGFTLRVNPEEVDAVFEAPLAFLMSPDNHERRSREWNGAVRHFYAMPFGEHQIWGVTAGIIRILYERLYAQ